MEKIQLPKKPNRYYFYNNVIPIIYSEINKGNYEFSFDMSHSELTNPEFLVGLLAASSLIRSKYSHISNLEIPSSSSKLFNYLGNSNFYGIASMPFNNVLNFTKYSSDYGKKNIKGYISKISCITENSDISTHQNNASKITYDFLQKLLDDKRNAENWNFYKLFELSLIQLAENFFEHNLYDNTYDCSCYYMAQKMPYGVIQIAFYDTGKGFRKRILEIVKKERDNIKKGVKPNSDLKQYIEIADKLNDKALIWKKTNENSNLLAIKAALDFRRGSDIPGLAVIKDFAISNGGSFFVHSSNASIEIDKYGNEKFRIFDENFSGVHFTIEIPLK
jgi:hypothetical protein